MASSGLRWGTHAETVWDSAQREDYGGVIGAGGKRPAGRSWVEKARELARLAHGHGLPPALVMADPPHTAGGDNVSPCPLGRSLDDGCRGHDPAR